MWKPTLALILTVLCAAGCTETAPTNEPPPVQDPPIEVPPAQEQEPDSSAPDEASQATDGNRLVLDAMRDAGADLSKATEVIWFIYFGRADRVASVLRPSAQGECES